MSIIFSWSFGNCRVKNNHTILVLLNFTHKKIQKSLDLSF